MKNTQDRAKFIIVDVINDDIQRTSVTIINTLLVLIIVTSHIHDMKQP